MTKLEANGTPMRLVAPIAFTVVEGYTEYFEGNVKAQKQIPEEPLHLFVSNRMQFHLRPRVASYY